MLPTSALAISSYRCRGFIAPSALTHRMTSRYVIAPIAVYGFVREPPDIKLATISSRNGFFRYKACYYASSQRLLQLSSVLIFFTATTSSIIECATFFHISVRSPPFTDCGYSGLQGSRSRTSGLPRMVRSHGRCASVGIGVILR